ncbi:MAG: polyhydroxyalkanoate synthesis regulator DNA-binding domain-containing protein [Pseudomonadota bacterium]
MRTIKKYSSNRRMYDTTIKKSVTLADIAVMIAEGERFQVIDKKSGEDLTTLTLAQVVVDQEKDRRGLTSVPLLLRELIERGRSSVLELLERSVLGALETISLTREKAHTMVQELLEKRKISIHEGENLLKSLLDKAEESTLVLEKRIALEIQKVIDRMEIATVAEVKKLRREITALNKKITALVDVPSLDQE